MLLDESQWSPFLSDIAQNFIEMQKVQAGKELFDYFSENKNNLHIFSSTDFPDDFGNAGIDKAGVNIYINTNGNSLIPTTQDYDLENSPLWINLAHEMAHRRDYIQRGRRACNANTFYGLPDTERVACHWENVMRGQSGLPLRTCYNSMDNPLLLEILGEGSIPNWSNFSRFFSIVENGLFKPYKY